MTRAGTVGGLVAVAVLVSGCVQTTGGTPVTVQGGAGPNPGGAPPLSASAISHVLLSAHDIGVITGGANLQITGSAEQMRDSSDTVSKRDCLGAVYGAEKTVYAGSGWTAARDQVLRSSDGQDDRWVEQSVVLYPSSQEAKDFFVKSMGDWKKCGHSAVAVDDGAESYIWNFDDVHKASESVITQVSTQEESVGWMCQHAMGVVSNVIAEGFACGYSVSDDAERIVNKMIQNAAAAK
jgi:hypothetical protein